MLRAAVVAAARASGHWGGAGRVSAAGCREGRVWSAQTALPACPASLPRLPAGAPTRPARDAVRSCCTLLQSPALNTLRQPSTWGVGTVNWRDG